MTEHFLHTILLAGVLFCMLNASAAAQQKIGYVNTDKILKKMPEYKGVQQQLNEISKRWRKKLATMQQKIDTLKTIFNAKKLLYSDKVKIRKQKEIRQLIKKRKQYLHQKFGPKGGYYKKQHQLLKPIQRRIYEAITTVADQNHIDFVFDRAQNSSLLFVRKQWNLNSDVLQQLNVR